MFESWSAQRAPARVLLVEANARLRSDLAAALERSGFIVEALADLIRSERLESRFDVFVFGFGTDCKVTALKAALAFAQGATTGLGQGAEAPSLILLGEPEAPSGTALRALQSLAADWLPKPFSVRDLERCIAGQLSTRDKRRSFPRDPMLVTQDPTWRRTLARVQTWAESAVPISLVGELGTGRRALAEQIHAWSRVASGPCIFVDSAELEGDGSDAGRTRFALAYRQAEQGTLIWSEPGLAPRAVQVQALGRLRSGGRGAPRWIVIGTESLSAQAELGRVDLELQYRLEAAPVRVPAIRQRPDDHAALCTALAGRVARELGASVPEIDAALVSRLVDGGCAGNRFGLETRLRSALVRSGGDAERFRADLETGGNAVASVRSGAIATTASLNLKDLERQTIVRALAHWDGNRTRASESLGISVRTLRNKIREYALR